MSAFPTGGRSSALRDATTERTVRTDSRTRQTKYMRAETSSGHLARPVLSKGRDPDHRDRRLAQPARASHACGLSVVHLIDEDCPIEVLALEQPISVVDQHAAQSARRHDFHELTWVRAGTARHLIDGEPRELGPNTLMVIARNQVNLLEHANDVVGVRVRFGDVLLHDGPARWARLGWPLPLADAPAIPVPRSEVRRLEMTIDTLASENQRPREVRSVELQRHALMVLLLFVERLADGSPSVPKLRHDPDVELYRRFAIAVERDFARQHDAGHYADLLATPGATLSRALSRVTGRTTKQLIGDRVMLEATRLLRFTNLSVGQIAFRVGFRDQLYFSRSFKQRFGEAPIAYRARTR